MHVPPPSSPADVQPTDQKYRRDSLPGGYFKSVTSLLDDLSGKRKSDEFVTWGKVGLWFRVRHQIDQLPILHVDPDLVDWGFNVSAQLRQAESSMKGIGAQTGYRLATAPNVQAYNTRTETAFGAGVGPYGGYRAGGAYAYQYAYNPKLSLALQGQQSTRSAPRSGSAATRPPT